MMRGTAWSIVLALAAGLIGPEPQAQEPAAGWRTFDGSWSAVGRRQTVPTEGDRAAAVFELSGAVTLSAGRDLSVGFRGEAIGFDDGRGASSGRAVWTDANGDRVFSTLTGEPVATGRRILGTMTGGTGRYAGIAGDYSLTWQYVVRGDEDGVVQGRAVDLKGRFRPGGTAR